MGSLEIVQADLSIAEHQQAVLDLTDAYSRDPAAGGEPLSEATRANLIDGLRRHPTTLILLACVGDKAVGIATCFTGFSTFLARPLINVHDLAVLPQHRGQGIGRQLLEVVLQLARARKYCKVTLEVQERNDPARRLYESLGFAPYVINDVTGGTLFLTCGVE